MTQWGARASIDTIKQAWEALRALGPIPFFVSSSLFPADRALLFEGHGRKYVCAGPQLWARLGDDRVLLAPTDLRELPIKRLFSCEIVDLDRPHNAQLRAEVVEAWVRAAGVPEAAT